MTMTRKHFEALATALATSVDHATRMAMDAGCDDAPTVMGFAEHCIVTEIAATLETFNPRFDADRFIDAVTTQLADIAAVR